MCLYKHLLIWTVTNKHHQIKEKQLEFIVLYLKNNTLGLAKYFYHVNDLRFRGDEKF